MARLEKRRQFDTLQDCEPNLLTLAEFCLRLLVNVKLMRKDFRF